MKDVITENYQLMFGDCLERMKEIPSGSGEYHAVGCLYNSKLTKPKEDIIKALECAENFVVSVSKPFTVLCI